MTEKKFITHYEKLKVSRDATDEEIIKSYNEILKKYNPEIETDEENKKKYIKINQIVKISFDTLIDKTKRKEHDDLISFIENDDLTKKSEVKNEAIIENNQQFEREATIENTSNTYKFNVLINKIKSLSKYLDKDWFNFMKKIQFKWDLKSKKVFFASGLLVFGVIFKLINLGDFVDNGDGTVSDKKTGLMWQRCSVGQEWKNNTCEGIPKKIKGFDVMKYNNILSSNFAGYNDWYVPSEKELMSLIECSDGTEYKGLCENQRDNLPSINSKYFPNLAPKIAYWTSSNSYGDGKINVKPNDGKRMIGFNEGIALEYYNWGLGHIILVRSEKNSEKVKITTDTDANKISKSDDTNNTTGINDISIAICNNHKEIMLQVIPMDKQVISLYQSKSRFNSEENINLRKYLYDTVDLIYSAPDDMSRKIIEKSFVKDCALLLNLR